MFFTCSPRPPTLSQRHMDLHVWPYPRPDYIFQVSSKSVQGFRAPGGQNLAFPITLASRFYNSLYYRTSRDIFHYFKKLNLEQIFQTKLYAQINLYKIARTRSLAASAERNICLSSDDRGSAPDHVGELTALPRVSWTRFPNPKPP